MPTDPMQVCPSPALWRVAEPPGGDPEGGAGLCAREHAPAPVPGTPKRCAPCTCFLQRTWSPGGGRAAVPAGATEDVWGAHPHRMGRPVILSALLVKGQACAPAVRDGCLPFFCAHHGRCSSA
eukprot:scaffold31993_cov18-Tisochrysis_lutea.AAC.1